MNANPNEIRESIEALIQEAERKGLWLHCYYQDIWRSPQQLREANAKGQFLWGPVNWSLRDPKERLDEARERSQRAAEEVRRITRDIEATP